MAEAINTKGFLVTRVTGEHRKGFCEKCGVQTEKEFYIEGNRKIGRASCRERV